MTYITVRKYNKDDWIIFIIVEELGLEIRRLIPTLGDQVGKGQGTKLQDWSQGLGDRLGFVCTEPGSNFLRMLHEEFFLKQFQDNVGCVLYNSLGE